MDLVKNNLKKDKELLTKNFNSSGVTSSDFVVNMSTIIVIVVAAIVILFIMIILALVLPSQNLRDKIKAKLVAAKDGFFWNGFIRSQSISYLTLCISLCALFKDMKEVSQVVNFAAVLAALILYPIGIMIYLSRE